MAYKSGFERSLTTSFKSLGIKFKYESTQIPYVLERTYTPDFELVDHGFFVEAKGLLDRDSKAKMIAVKKQHPEIDVRFCFMDAKKKIPGTKQSHGEWATKNGFLWCERELPEEWLCTP